MKKTEVAITNASPAPRTRVTRPLAPRVKDKELVEFDVVHAPAAADLRGVQHREHVVVVHVDLGHVVAFQAVPDRDVVEPKRFRQHHRGPPVAPRDVHPDQRFRPAQQIVEVLHRARLHPELADQIHLHTPPPSSRRIGPMSHLARVTA
jgi:hypothetical protein